MSDFQMTSYPDICYTSEAVETVHWLGCYILQKNVIFFFVSRIKLVLVAMFHASQKTQARWRTAAPGPSHSDKRDSV